MSQIVSDVFLYVVPFAVMISFLVAIHEWGHYAAATAVGIRATVFSIGMGPTLWSRTDRRGCVWRIAALPVGGYVRFLGDAGGSSAAPEKGFDASAAPGREVFHLRGPLARAFVIAAGPAVNIVFGILVLTALYAANGQPYTPPVVAEVVAGSPADRAGLKAGDTVLTVDGKEIDRFETLFEEISARLGGTVDLEVRRDGYAAPLDFAVSPESVLVEAMGTRQTVARIGIVAAGTTELRSLGPGEALVAGLGDAWKMTTGTLTAIVQIFTGVRPVSDLGGPVRIAEMSATAASIGMQTMVFFTALFSLNLGILNLFPLPVLDGGQLLVCAAEGARRRPFRPKTLGWLQAAGTAVLVGVFALLTVNDVGSILSRIFA